MVTLRDKITFTLTALAYGLFHLRMGVDAGAILYGTVYQVLLTAPYAIGFTYIIADIISSIPYLWLAALVLFTLVAFFGVRHTKKGYHCTTG